MLVVIDYGMGNLKSVENALMHLDIPFIISGEINDLRNSTGLLLPGVGSFMDGMKNLKEKGLDVVIKEEVKNGKPLLGICLGMQMLFDRSFEVKETEGLGLIGGEIELLNPKVKVKIPHIGWNKLDKINNDYLIENLDDSSFVYYVHSFGATNVEKENLLCTSEYGGINIPGLVKKRNVYGAQFHPEKSGDVGLKLLKKFGELIL